MPFEAPECNCNEREVQFTCSQCDISLCKQCDEKQHFCSKFKLHKRLSYSGSTDSITQCSIHTQPLTLFCQMNLHDLVWNGKQEEAIRIINTSSFQDLNARDQNADCTRNSRTPLMLALLRHSIEDQDHLIHDLLEHQADPNVTDHSGCSPLMLCMSLHEREENKRWSRMAALLVEKKACINYESTIEHRTRKDEYANYYNGRTALTEAFSFESQWGVQWLLGKNANIQNRNGTYFYDYQASSEWRETSKGYLFLLTLLNQWFPYDLVLMIWSYWID